MGWFDRILSWIGFELQEAEEEVAAAEEPRQAPVSRRRVRERVDRPVTGPVVALPGGAVGAAPLRVVILSPRAFEDVQVAADHLKARRPIILNLEATDRELAQRVINFLSGTIYALSGEMHRVGTNVLFFAPGGVEVTMEGRVPRREPPREAPPGGYGRSGE